MKLFQKISQLIKARDYDEVNNLLQMDVDGLSASVNERRRVLCDGFSINLKFESKQNRVSSVAYIEPTFFPDKEPFLYDIMEVVYDGNTHVCEKMDSQAGSILYDLLMTEVE